MAIDLKAMRRTPEGYFTVRWGLPEYTDWIDESMSWKKTCYIGDWSFIWKCLFKGPDVLKLFSDISVNSFAKFGIGHTKHYIHCNDEGKIIHEGIIDKLDKDEYMMHGRGCFWANYKLRKSQYDVTTKWFDQFFYMVAGPKSIYVIEKASDKSIRDIAPLRTRYIYINGREVRIVRHNMAGELGYELHGPAEYSSEVYDAIVTAGKEFGIRKLGGRTATINHIEACFPTIIVDYLPAIFNDDMHEYLEEFKKKMPGHLITFNIAGSFETDDVRDYYRSPIEFGWTNRVKFDHDFIGRKALETEVSNPKRTTVTLVWNSEDIIDVYTSLFRKDKTPYHYIEIPREQRGFLWCDQVLKDDKLVGLTASRGYSYYFRELISLCTIDIEYSKPGTEVTVVWGNPGEPQKHIRATVAPAPYKKDNRFIDVTKLPFYL